MKKILLSLALLAGLGTAATAQSPAFAKGEKLISVSLGYGTVSGGSLVIPPLSAVYETVAKDNVFGSDKCTLAYGGQFDFSAYSFTSYEGSLLDLKEVKKTASSFFVGPRASIHYTLVDKLDTYFGLGIGYGRIAAFGVSGGGFAWNSFVGLRYFFTPKWGAVLESGYGIGTGLGKIGVSYKF